MPACSHLLGAAAALLCLSASCAKNPNTTVLNEWPMLMVHDAATTYLREGDLLNKTVLDWTITQPQGIGTAGELDCGARGFDWRPSLVGGKLVMHHGSVTINYPMGAAVDSIVAWAANNTAPSDLVVLGVTDCDGTGCDQAVQKLLAQRQIKFVSDCSDLKGLTVGEARKKYELPTGGFVMALVNPCGWEENYVPANACSGTGHTEGGDVVGDATAGDDAALVYKCYADSRTKAFPVNRMMDYLGKIGATPASAGGQLSTAQALWEETAASVVIGVADVTAPPPCCAATAPPPNIAHHAQSVRMPARMQGSSLLLDESRSQLNKLLTARVKANAWEHVNFIEINNVCNGGPELWQALQQLP